MSVDPSAFSQVQLNTRGQSKCSPPVDDDFRGMVIATPDKIDLAAPWQEGVGVDHPLPVWPVCGTAQYTAATDAKFPSLTNQILLVAVDARTHGPYVSNLVRKGFEPKLSPPVTPEQLEEWKHRVMTSFFNANAFYFIGDLPAAPSHYHVFAMVGDIVSNVRTVEVVGSGNGRPVRHIAPGDATFGRAAHAPAVAPTLRGVKIESRVKSWAKGEGAIWIDGVVQLDGKDAAGIGAKPIQQAVVVTVMSGLTYRSWNVSGERVLLGDDEEHSPGQGVRGVFSFDISKAFAPSADQGVYVLVSVGPFLSNVLFLPSS